jgi:hypothetical protein
MLPRLFPQPGATNHQTHASSGWGRAPLVLPFSLTQAGLRFSVLPLSVCLPTGAAAERPGTRAVGSWEWFAAIGTKADLKPIIVQFLGVLTDAPIQLSQTRFHCPPYC